MKKLCFITSSRADYGTVEILIDRALKSNKLKSNLVITGSHSNPIFGSGTEIKRKKRLSIFKIPIKTKNINTVSVLNSFSDSIKKLTKLLKKINPDVVIIFGDRYEMLSSAITAYVLGINIVHIAGGEKTIGSLDDGFRNSITKLSNLHFPVTKEYKSRLIQMGENPKTVFNYGSLNYEKIKKNNYLSKEKLEKKFKFKFLERNIIVTFHPSIDSEGSVNDINILLKELKKLKKTLVIITSPNADAKGVVLINKIKKFIKTHKLRNFHFIKSMGSQNYLSTLRYVDGAVGNSSSGISEVPFFGIGTINLGDRQTGRVFTSSIFNAKINSLSIKNSLKKIFNKKMRRKFKISKKIYGNGNSSKKIINKIIKFNFKKYKKKIFYDLKTNLK